MGPVTKAIGEESRQVERMIEFYATPSSWLEAPANQRLSCLIHAL
jgi:hypothetical protein